MRKLVISLAILAAIVAAVAAHLFDGGTGAVLMLIGLAVVLGPMGLFRLVLGLVMMAKALGG